MPDIRITSYPRWGTADVQALTDKATHWLSEFTVLAINPNRPIVTVDADAVPEYIEGAKAAGLEVEA